MAPEFLEEFLSMYPQIPRSTFFLHEFSNGWFTDDHEMGPHPTIGTLNVHSLGTEREQNHVGIRSHSCVNSHMLSLEWSKAGYYYQSNETEFLGQGREPYRTAWGIWEFPVSYMDNMDFYFGSNWKGIKHEPFSAEFLKRAHESETPFVFDFHPVHIALNSRNIQKYAEVKSEVLLGANPWKFSTAGTGVRTYFENLLSIISEDKGNSRSLIDYLKMVNNE